MQRDDSSSRRTHHPDAPHLQTTNESITPHHQLQHRHLAPSLMQHQQHVHSKSSRLLVLIFDADGGDTMRSLTRKELLDEARAASLPTRLRPQSSLDINAAAASGTEALLKLRDVRKVDPHFSGKLEPVILVRRGCILVSLGRNDVRAIICYDHLFFLVPDGADSVLAEIRGNLAMLLDGPGKDASDAGDSGPRGAPNVAAVGDDDESTEAVPFERAALEAILMIACSDIHKRYEVIASRTREALLALRRTVLGTRVVAGSKQLEAVREVSEQVRELTLTAQALDRALSGCLEEDEDMAGMYLTRLQQAAHSTVDGSADHEEVEILLESYVQEVNATLSALEGLSYQIESTEKFVSLRLDSGRNRLLKVDVFAGIAASIFGFGSFVGSLFGMNLKTPLFDRVDGLYFNLVCWLVGVTIILAFAALVYFFSPAASRREHRRGHACDTCFNPARWCCSLEDETDKLFLRN